MAGYQAVGILGTKTVMQTGMYGCLPDVKVLPPQGAALDAVHEAYVAMAAAGCVTEAQRRVFFDCGRALCEGEGAEAVLLGGTDLVLAFDGRDCGFKAIVVTVDTPRGGVTAVLEALGRELPLTQGPYDNVLFVRESCLQRFRALEGSHAGAEGTIQETPAQQIVFSLPPDRLDDPRLLRAVDYITHLLTVNRYYDWENGPLGHAIRALALFDERVYGRKPGIVARWYEIDEPITCLRQSPSPSTRT